MVKPLGLTLLLLIAATRSSADAVDDYLARELRRQHIPGLSVAVIKDGRVVKAKGYGLANVETGTPAGPATVYKIASVSKQFLAAAVLLLVQDGKVGLDDRLAQYLEDAPAHWQPITVRQLLSHTSGLERDTPGYTPFSEQQPREILALSYSLPLVFPPGERWQYSNLGYYALAEIITRASGLPWERFLAERLFAPAKLAATRTTTNTELVSNRASGYVWTGERLELAANVLSLRPSGAFLSTVLDLARWDALLTSGMLLDASSRDALFTPARLADGAVSGYAFGWFVDTFRGRRRIRHDGGLPGFSAEYARYPDDRLTVIVLANGENLNAARTAERIAGFYVPAVAPPPPIPDRDPDVTTLVRTFLAKRINPAPDPTLFTPEFLALVTPGWSSRLDYFRILGPLRSLHLLERGTDGTLPWYRYRATYDNVTLLVRFTIKEGRIAGGQFAEE